MQVMNWIGLNTILYINIPINNTNGLLLLKYHFSFETQAKTISLTKSSYQTPISQKRFASSSFGRYMPSPWMISTIPAAWNQIESHRQLPCQEYLSTTYSLCKNCLRQFWFDMEFEGAGKLNSFDQVQIEWQWQTLT